MAAPEELQGAPASGGPTEPCEPTGAAEPAEALAAAPALPREPLPAEIALAASALCEATDDDEQVAELMQRYWKLDEETATRSVTEARGRLLLATKKDDHLTLAGILDLDDRSFESIGDYMETYVEENAEAIRTGVKGGGIKFVVSQTLKFLYNFFYKYLAVLIEPLIALLLKIFPFLPLP